MKRLLVLLAIPLASRGQSSFKHTTDRFTGENSASLKSLIILKNSRGTAAIDFYRSTKLPPSIQFHISDNFFGCTMDNHIVRFLFSDGYTSTGNNSVKGCDGSVLIIFNDPLATMNARLAENLRSKTLTAIRFESDKYGTEFDVPPAVAKKIYASAAEIWNVTVYDTSASLDSNAASPHRAKVQQPVKIQ